jgi:hypothetical protein
VKIRHLIYDSVLYPEKPSFYCVYYSGYGNMFPAAIGAAHNVRSMAKLAQDKDRCCKTSRSEGLQVVMMGLAREKDNIQPKTPGKQKDPRNSHFRPEEAELSTPAKFDYASSSRITTKALPFTPMSRGLVLRLCWRNSGWLVQQHAVLCTTWTH